MHSLKSFFNPLRSLYFTQFLSAFADNAIFFTILALIGNQGIENPESHMAIVQAAFLISYVVLAPIVGAIADKNAKSSVLLAGNLIKGLGAILLFVGFSPALSYAIVGIGAVVYSPAKYGILPELTKNEKELLDANAKIEAYTILAILLGGVGGGFLGSYSVTLGIIACIVLYIVSLVMTFLIPKMAGNASLSYKDSIKGFFKDFATMFRNKKVDFSLVGTGSFWFASSVLRIGFLVFIADVLEITNTGTQSLIVASSAVGIVVGSLLTPKIIPPTKYTRVFYFGLVLMFVIFASAFAANIWMTVLFLFAIGFLEGVYVVPMNTIVQDEGKKLIGSGKAIAIQNFVNNAFMLVGIGAYQVAISKGVPIQYAIMGIGVVMGLLLLYLRTKMKALRNA